MIGQLSLDVKFKCSPMLSSDHQLLHAGVDTTRRCFVSVSAERTLLLPTTLCINQSPYLIDNTLRSAPLPSQGCHVPERHALLPNSPGQQKTWCLKTRVHKWDTNTSPRILPRIRLLYWCPSELKWICKWLHEVEQNGSRTCFPLCQHQP